MSACIVCGGRLRTINEDGDQECVASPDHGYDDLVPPPELELVTAEAPLRDWCGICGHPTRKAVGWPSW